MLYLYHQSSVVHAFPFTCRRMPSFDDEKAVGTVFVESRETGNYSKNFMVVDFTSHKIRLYPTEAEVCVPNRIAHAGGVMSFPPPILCVVSAGPKNTPGRDRLSVHHQSELSYCLCYLLLQ